MQVMGVDVLRIRLLLRFAAARHLFIQLEFFLFVFFQVIGIDAGRLVGCGQAGAPGCQAGFDRSAEITGVKRDPRVKRGGVLRQRFTVATMQALPCLPDRCSRVFISLFGIRKRGPAGFLRHRIVSRLSGSRGSMPHKAGVQTVRYSCDSFSNSSRASPAR